MKKHVFIFLITFILLSAATMYISPYLPESVPRFFPAPQDLVPDFIKNLFISEDGTDAESDLEKDSDKIRTVPAMELAEAVFQTRSDMINREEGLQHFYNQLALLRDGTIDTVRVMQLGDSVNWFERVARTIRMGLTEEFGDGGRGQVYMHDDWGVALEGNENLSTEGFSHFTIPYEFFNHIEEKWLPFTGFTGWTYQAQSPEAVCIQKFDKESTPVSVLRLLLRNSSGTNLETQKVYFHDPENTDIILSEHEVALDGQNPVLAEIRFPPAHEVAFSFGEPGVDSYSALIDGAYLETGKGVSFSSFIHKGRIMTWFTAVLPDIFEKELALVKPDLLIFQYGINESASIAESYLGFTREYYVKQMRELFTRIKKASPETDVLIIGPYERLQVIGGIPTSYKAHNDVRLLQKQVAEEFGFAFFDSFSFLGGKGHLQRMMKQGLAAGDYAHLNDKGSEILGKEIYRLIWNGYADTHSEKIIEESETVIFEETEVELPTPILFNSLSFGYFFILVFLIASFFSRIPWARLIFLTAASLYFYASWQWWAGLLMMFSIVVDFFCAKGIEWVRKKGGPHPGLFLALSLCTNLGILFFFKYYDFFANLVNPFLGNGNFFQIPVLDLILPVGISFYTFQSLSYTMDVFRGNLKPEKNLIRYAFYVSFFPQLVAGPIVRATEFLPALKESIRHFFPGKKEFSSSVFLFTKGLLKKTLADWISVNFVDKVFLDPSMFTSTEAIVAVLAFGIQIYLDFSSYTDMAIAVARMLGFNLTRNFDRPYVSKSITEFWRRWHISLSTWLRDYLYISLGGNRNHLYRNLFLTMLLGGLWHGAGINFVLWGIFHGVLLMLERALNWEKLTRKLKALAPFSIAFTFILIMFSWILFRCRDWSSFIAIVQTITAGNFSAPNVDAALLSAVLLPYIWQWIPEKVSLYPAVIFERLKPVLQACAVYLCTIWVFLLSTSQAKAFIYFQF